MPSHPKLLSHMPALCNTVQRVAVDAGELLLEYFEGMHDLELGAKEDGSPVTIADKKAEELIEQKLYEILPDVPVIGEESFSAGRRTDLEGQAYFWLIDPLDGTKAFVKGDPDFTVNIGLIHNGEPILGVIYAPEKGELYAGFSDKEGAMKSFRYFEDSKTEKDIRARKMPAEGLTVMSSSYHSTASLHDKMLEQFKVKKIVRRASSIKICAIANGKADVYPRFGPTCEWDTAAGHAILRAAGGEICDLKGKPLSYGGADPNFLNPHFIAASSEFFEFAELPL